MLDGQYNLLIEAANVVFEPAQCHVVLVQDLTDGVLLSDKC